MLPLLAAASLAGADDAPAPASTPEVAAAVAASLPAAPAVAEPVVVLPPSLEPAPSVPAPSTEPVPAPSTEPVPAPSTEPAPALPSTGADATPALVAADGVVVRPADLEATPPADLVAPEPTPLPSITDDNFDPEALREVAQIDVAALGPLSIGTPDAGLLVNPRPMPEGTLWTIRNPLETWGTQETIDFVVAAVESVEQRFPGSPRVVIGDISRPDGGRLNRHKSHQAGRDIDVGFYYASGEASNFTAVQARSRSRRRAAAAPQLDLPRTWALMRAFLTETDVDRIFLDRSLIAVLYRYAREEEQEDPAWLDDVFGRAGRKGLVQHEKKHKDHMHVRFFNRVAQERGRIVYPLLVESGVVGPPLVRHRVRRGETIGHLAEAYGTSVSAIRAANHLRGNTLRAGRSYLVPVRRVRGDGEPVVVPPRRLPPTIATQAASTPAPSAPSSGAATDAAVAAGGRN